MQGKPAFGVFVPTRTRRPARGGARRCRRLEGRPRPKPRLHEGRRRRLAANPLYDFVFLNLEGAYDSEAVKSIAEGLRSKGATSRKTLIVRIPAFHEDPAARARASARFSRRAATA